MGDNVRVPRARAFFAVCEFKRLILRPRRDEGNSGPAESCVGDTRGGPKKGVVSPRSAAAVARGEVEKLRGEETTLRVAQNAHCSHPLCA